MFTVDEAAAHLGVHETTIRRWIRAGELPAVRRGRTVRVDRRDLIVKKGNT
jgi:excisionase family DNA binding protein